MGAWKIARVAAVAAGLLACTGPQVSVGDIRCRPSPVPGAQRVEATLVNAGGQGEVKVAVRLREQTDGRIFGADRTVQIRKHERLELVVDVPAPSGAYAPILEVEFPP